MVQHRQQACHTARLRTCGRACGHHRPASMHCGVAARQPPADPECRQEAWPGQAADDWLSSSRACCCLLQPAVAPAHLSFAFLASLECRHQPD